ncbi:MAG TPA: APC family permease [Rhizomicrobium sp.]|jgi:APA family basic amino acid/polyamine antiporter
MTTISGPRGHLLKILGVSFGVAVSVGQIIGSGILRAPAEIAGEVPGVGLILILWILGAIQAAMMANMFAELSTALPKSGGGYVFAHRAFGDVGGLIYGWADWLSCLAGAAAASVSFAEFLPLVLPAAGGHKIAVAVALQLALYAANIAGLREGRAIQLVTSLVKAAMLFVFILTAILFAAPAEPKTALVSSSLWSVGGIVLAYKLIIGAYAGWATPVYFTGENVEPSRSIPRALFIGIALTGLLYFGINAALLHVLGNRGAAASPLPFTTVLQHFGGDGPSFLFALTAMITVASCANACIMPAPRILYALAQDGLLPRAFGIVNGGGSPTFGFVFSGLVSIGLALSGTFALVFGLIGTLNTALAVLVELGFFVLRRREPHLVRPFRAVGYPWLPGIELGFDVSLLCLIAFADRVGVAVALGLGLLCIPFAIMARRTHRRSSQTVP